jgi:hypothetical protein
MCLFGIIKEDFNGSAVSAREIAQPKQRKGQSSDGWLKFIISSSSVLRKVR